MSSPSIRRTLLLRCGIGVGVLLWLFSTGAYLLVKRSFYLEVEGSIAETAALLANQVELEKGTITYEWKEGIGTNPALIADGYFQFWDESSGSTTRSPGLHSQDLPRFCGTDGSPHVRTIVLPNGHRARAIGLRIYPFVLPDELARMKDRGQVIDPQSLPHILVVARDSEPVHRTLERLRWLLATGSLLALGLGFLVIDRVIRVTLRPIDRLTLQMKDRAEHQLDSALDVPGEMPVELAGLAANFDKLLARVAAIRQREREFIRNAAHELRTPIAGLRATTDLALSQPREAAAYAEHLAACQKTSVELGELVNRLSALSRIGKPTAPPLCEPVDIDPLLTACIKPFLPLYQQRGLQVKREFSDDPMLAAGDATLLRIIFNNLLDNALSYASPGSEILIHSRNAHEQVEILIANPANDLPENLERLFEPLFRKDNSRSSAGVHLGIGLTLSLEAAHAMGATLLARCVNVGWIEFVLSIPASSLR